jgi:GWxTD domain-containing protein
MNSGRAWRHAFSRELFSGFLSPRLVITLICLLGNADELSTSSAAKTKPTCDFLETWLSQDVVYIIPETERAWAREAQKSNDCDFAVQQFWALRDPTPDTINNEFKEEFYDRIRYANAHFGTGDRMGRKTSRGRVYIAWGAPDWVEAGKGGYSFETWHYLNKEKHYGLEGSIEFQDPTGNGTHDVVMSVTAQRALSRIPNTRSDIKELTDGVEIICRRPPQVQLKDLETVLNVGLSYNLLPFTCRTEHIQVTECTTMTVIVVEVRRRHLAYSEAKGNLDNPKVFGRVRREKMILDAFEGTLSATSPERLRESPSADFLLFKKAVPLSPGAYSLELAIKDNTTGNVGTLYRSITVP